MSRYLCTYEEIITRVVGEDISVQQNNVKRCRLCIMFFLTEALRAHWTCVQLRYGGFEFVEVESKVVVEGTITWAFLIR